MKKTIAHVDEVSNKYTVTKKMCKIGSGRDYTICSYTCSSNTNYSK